MADSILQLLLPMETLVSSTSPPSIIHYTVTLDLPTSIIFSLTIFLFFLFLFHALTAVLHRLLDLRPSGDLEAGDPVRRPSDPWIVRAVETFMSRFEERRLRRLRALERLPAPEKMEESGGECAICLEEFERGEWGQVLPECRHVFHWSCVELWLSKKLTCPVCRNCILDS